MVDSRQWGMEDNGEWLAMGILETIVNVRQCWQCWEWKGNGKWQIMGNGRHWGMTDNRSGRQCWMIDNGEWQTMGMTDNGEW